MGLGCLSAGKNESIIEIKKKKLEQENKVNLKKYTLPVISNEDYKFVEQKIQETTGFKPYYSSRIKLNKNQKKIEGTYFQYNKGCILYALINNGWLDEQYVPDSMKFYKDHNHREDERNPTNLLRKSMSIIDLAQLWVNIGGKCPYLEIDLKEAKNRIYLVLKEYFADPDKNKELMKKVSSMTWQNKDYFELVGDINIKRTPLMEIIENNPCIKNGIDSNIIKQDDIIKFGRHCFIFDKVFEENSNKIYSFHDSLSYFFTNKHENYNNAECNKVKGYIYAHEDTKLININNTLDMDIAIVTILN